MIPDHLIDKAARAMHVNDPGGGETEEYEDTPPWYQVVTERRARAALEAVAAEIWDQGWDVGRRLQGPNSNPYRNEDA